MRALGFKWAISVVGLVFALAAVLAVPSAGALETTGTAPFGDVSRHAAFSEQPRHASAVDRPGRAAAMIGALGIGADGELRLRSGGSGVLTISLARQVDRPVRIADQRVTVKVPREYRAGSIEAPGWRCARRGATVRCGAPGTAVAGSLGPIQVGLRARRAGAAAIEIHAAWRKGRRRYSGADTSRFRVRAPLEVRARSSAASVLAPAPGLPAAPIVLSARLGRSAKGLPVTYRWHQVCQRGCRRVDWTGPASGRASGTLATARVRVPRVARPTRLRFAVTATSWRGRATATTTVLVRPQANVRLRSPRRLRLLKPARRRRGAKVHRQIARALASVGALGIDTSAAPGASAAPGTSAAPGVSPAPGVAPAPAPGVAPAPAAARRRPAVPTAPRRSAPRSARKRSTPLARALATASDAGPGNDPFCAIWSDAAAGDATIELADGSAIALGDPTRSGEGCDAEGAAIQLTDATLEAAGVRFVDVAGTVDAEGLRLLSGSLQRPAGWSEELPDKLPIDLGESAVWAGAELTEDGWGPLRAQAALDEGLEVLPLPAGWSFPAGESTLEYEPLQGAFALHAVARPPRDERGEVRLDGSLADGTTTVTVEAEDLAVLSGTGDSAVGLSGTGEVTAGPGGALSGSVRLATEEGAAIPLAGGVEVDDAVGTWDEDGIALGGNLRVQSGDGAFEARVDGSFVSTAEWKLEIVQSAPFALTEGVTLAGVHGLLGRSPAAAKVDGAKAGEADGEEPGSAFAIELSGTVEGWDPSPQLSGVHVTGRLTNVCAEDAKGCDPGAVRLAMEVGGTAHVLGQTIPWDGEAEVNLKTLALRFSAGARLAEFGPAALSLTGVELRMTNEGPQWCTAPGADASSAPADAAAPSTAADDPGAPATADDPAAADNPAPLAAHQELSFSVTGDGRILGQPFRAQAELTSSGYCLAGTFGRFDPDGLTAGDRPLIDRARLLYATRDARVSLAGRTVAVEANQLRLSGDLNLPARQLPAQLRDVLGGRNEVTLTIARSEGGFALDGQASFSFARPVYLLGDAAHADRARLQARSAQLAFAFSSASGLRLGLGARAALLTPANAAKGIAASTTPLFLTAGVDLGKPSVALSAGVDTDDPSVVDGTVADAFGQPGLDVRKLVVAASLGTETSFGISAAATLPSAWTSSLGMSARAPAAVAFNVSQTAPCLELAVGDPPPADGGTSLAPTVMKLGALSASYARIVVAPTGCRIGGAVPGTPATEVDPGFSLGFDGQIGTAPVTFVASMRLEKQAFALRTKVRVGAFDAGAIRFRRTALDLDIELGAARRRVDVAFSGDLDLGESNVDVEGRFFADENTISAALKGQGRLRLAGRTFAEGRIDAALDFRRQNGSWKAGSARVDARTTVLGASVGVIFAYRDGTVSTAAGAFEYAAGAGPAQLRGGVLFAYAPDGVSLRGDGCNVGQLAPQGAEQLLLRVCGGLTVGSLRRDLQMTVALPRRYDFDLRIPRSEVGIYVASVYFEGSLQASLQLGLEAPGFWVRDGYARAGGCVSMVFWRKCADGVSVDFKPATGRFEGRFLGIPVAWGSDSWRVAPAAAEAGEPAIGAGDRVFLQTAAGVTLDQRAAGGAWRRNAYSPSRGLEVPAGAVLDPDRSQISMLVPLPADLRGSVAKPALGYMLTFSGVAFDGSRPRTAGGGAARSIAYSSLSVARVTGAGVEGTVVERDGTLSVGADGLSLGWNAEATPPPSPAESALAGAAPKLVADGLPLGIALRFAAAEPTAESRKALERRLD